MSKEYNKKINEIVDIISNQISDDAQQLTQQELEALKKSLEKTEELINEITSLPVEIDETNDLNQIIAITEKIIAVLQQAIKFKINIIDAKTPGFFSRQSNKLYSLSKDAKQTIGIDKNDESIFIGIINGLFKPIASFLNIFKAITPDKWRIANTKERVKLILGLALTLTGLACIVAAIVLSLATPAGALIAGIGIAVVYGSIGLGFAAVCSLIVGGVFLDNVGKDLSKRLGYKKDLQGMEKRCVQCKQTLDAEAPVIREISAEIPKPKDVTHLKKMKQENLKQTHEKMSLIQNTKFKMTKT